MSDVERLRDELALAEEGERLEKAREKMHADRSPKNAAAYRAACEKLVAVRQAFRTKYPTIPSSDADGVARPDPVKATGRAVEPR